MSVKNSFGVNCETFSAQLEDGVGVIKFKKNFLLRTADLADRDAILGCLDFFSKDEGTTGVILFGAADSKGKAEYMAFFHLAMTEGLNTTLLHRMLNVINQIILKLAGLEKMCVYADSGNVLPHFLNLSLVCDYSIFAEHTIIQNPCTEMGIVPVGGGAYLMTKVLSRKKAFDVLLSNSDITSHEALALGLVDRIVKEDHLRDAAFDALKGYGHIPANALAGVKRLLQYPLRDIGDYLEFENEEFLKRIRTSKFWNRNGAD